MSHTARSDRPMRRWISWVRPDCLPAAASRRMRSADEPGSMPYSAVTQPLPLPFIQRGTSSSTDAVHSTTVPPAAHEHRPAGLGGEVTLEGEGAQLVVLSAVSSHGRTLFARDHGCLTLPAPRKATGHRRSQREDVVDPGDVDGPPERLAALGP